MEYPGHPRIMERSSLIRPVKQQNGYSVYRLCLACRAFANDWFGAEKILNGEKTSNARLQAVYYQSCASTECHYLPFAASVYFRNRTRYTTL